MRHLRHLKYVLRLLVVALFALALLTPALPTYTTTIADARPASAADDDDGQDDDDDEDGDDERGRRRDPCRKALKRAAKGKPLPPECDPGSSGGAAKGDFNGDGFADLAVGVPNEDVGPVVDAGAVSIIYGSSTGLTADIDQFLDESTFGFSLAPDDHFGSALAAGDFNGDTLSDLAIGVPDRDIGSFSNAGRVLLIDGSPNGLDTSTTRNLSLSSPGRAGAALVWADFNGDSFGDLAVGIPEAGIPVFVTAPFNPCFQMDSVSKAGEVRVFYGGNNGLNPADKQILQQGSANNECGGVRRIGDGPEANDRFGSVLAAGNFKGSAADLVVGVPAEDLGVANAGLVHLIGGSSLGLGKLGAPMQILTQNIQNLGDHPELGDQFGRALGIGDFNGDLLDDLAVGVPFEDVGNIADAGLIHVFPGVHINNMLISPPFNFSISQNQVPGEFSEAGDLFGWSLAVGNFDGSIADDLAVGVPSEDFGTATDSGQVHVFYNFIDLLGLSLFDFQTWHQGPSNDILDFQEEGDLFGYALSAWNYGKSLESDLAIGVPLEDLPSATSANGKVDAGAVNVIYGSPTGLTPLGNQFWHQDIPGIAFTAEADDHFGLVLY